MDKIKAAIQYRKTEIIAGIIIGIMTYGEVLFNKYSVHDDTELYWSGLTFGLGRWSLGIFDKAFNAIVGSHYSMPLFNGIITICFLVATAIIILNIFNIKNIFLSITFIGTVITLPAFIGMTGYMFTAPYYAIGNFLTVLGCYYINKEFSSKNKYKYFLGIVLITFAVGIYQTNIVLALCVCALCFIEMIIKNNEINLVKSIIKYSMPGVLSLLFYLIINKILTTFFNVFIYDYKSLNSNGIMSMKGMLDKVILAYKEFFLPSRGRTTDMHPGVLFYFYEIIVFIIIVCAVILTIKLFRKKVIYGVITLLLIAIMPIAINVAYIICEEKQVYTLMMSTSYITYLLLIFFANSLDVGQMRNIFISSISIIMMIISIGCCRYANACYLKADLIQEELKSYYTTLITRIESIKGYSIDKEVVYIGEYKKNEDSVVKMPQLEVINIAPWTRHQCGLNSYAWKRFMKVWCGFNPKVGSEKQFINNKEVKKMACYPDEGSIKLIDNKIVVKFH